MTLPTDINFPTPENLLSEGGKYNVETYLKEMNDRLADMYQNVAQNVNGYVKDWTPIVYGTTSEGTGTYVNQFGWVRRAGILTECWMDVSWTAHTGTGRVAIQMPYQAANSQGSPFVGLIESSGTNAFPGFTYLTWRVEPNTTEGVIVRNGDSVPSARLGIAGSGGFRGYIRYIGKEFEDQ
jgi:hypothetical protein